MHGDHAQSFWLLLPLFYQISLTVTLEILTSVKYLIARFIQALRFLTILIYISVSLYSLVKVRSKERFSGLPPIQVPCCPWRWSNGEPRAERPCGSSSRFTMGITETAFCISVIYFRRLCCMFAPWQDESYEVNKYTATTNEQANGRKCCFKKNAFSDLFKLQDWQEAFSRKEESF